MIIIGLIKETQLLVTEEVTLWPTNTPYAERKETGSDQLENEASWAW